MHFIFLDREPKLSEAFILGRNELGKLKTDNGCEIGIKFAIEWAAYSTEFYRDEVYSLIKANFEYEIEDLDKFYSILTRGYITEHRLYNAISADMNYFQYGYSSRIEVCPFCTQLRDRGDICYTYDQIISLDNGSHLNQYTFGCGNECFPGWDPVEPHWDGVDGKYEE